MDIKKFNGTFDELKEALKDIFPITDWIDKNENLKQYRHKDGGILNWYSTTKTFVFQGPSAEAEKLKKMVIDVEDSLHAKSSEAILNAEENMRKVFNFIFPDSEQNSKESDCYNDSNNTDSPNTQSNILDNPFTDSELIIGLVGAVGTNLNLVSLELKQRLKVFGYTVEEIHISTDVITEIVNVAGTKDDNYKRISSLMDAGNQARKESDDNSILAEGTAKLIAKKRDNVIVPEKTTRKKAYIINSLKHPDEVARLREIYPLGFYQIGVHADKERRAKELVDAMMIDPELATELMERDEDEHLKHGQKVTDTFHLSDFFVRLDGDIDLLRQSVWRILNVLFGAPYITPTFDEYAMFMAFVASLRSADLSRQVGAIIARENEVLSTGANDCPKFGGGLYWPDNKTFEDVDNGRDYKKGQDSNKREQKIIISEIVSKIINKLSCKDNEKDIEDILKRSSIADLTEFGRVVHAEMEALLCCARNNIATKDATLYCTTFPCHNCAKHIVAAGLKRVLYIEPYQKSKAAEFHTDSISIGFSEEKEKVHFEPFVGVGPRRFFDLFSTKLGSGFPINRKDKDGMTVDWKPEYAKLRLQMLPYSYKDLEKAATEKFDRHLYRD